MEAIFLEKSKLCQYGKEIKKKLVDIDKNQAWLIEQVQQDTGLYFDSGYLYKVLTGRIKTPTIVQSIDRVLGVSSMHL